jgi:hypothetical protein
MKLLRISVLFIISAVLASFTYAGTPNTRGLNNPVTVLELFTSQGCSSCPPANKFVRDMTEAGAGSGDLLTLSYSVDYWDYLGWKDTLGKPEFSERQRTYGRQFGGKVYTPQMVVNGALHGSKFSDTKVKAQKLVGTPQIMIEAAGDDINIQVAATPISTKPLSIMAVRYRQGIESVPVKRGENRGRTINLANVVQTCKEIGRIKTEARFSKTLPALTDGEALVIFVQDGKGGPILGAMNYTP